MPSISSYPLASSIGVGDTMLIVRANGTVARAPVNSVSRGLVGASAVTLNLPNLGIASGFFLNVAPDTGCTIKVEFSIDAGSNWTTYGTLGSAEDIAFTVGAGETAVNRVRLTRMTGSSTASAYSLGPTMAQSVLNLGQVQQQFVNAPGGTITQQHFGKVLVFEGNSQSVMALPKDTDGGWANPKYAPFICFQRVGLGLIYVNPLVNGEVTITKPVGLASPDDYDINSGEIATLKWRKANTWDWV